MHLLNCKICEATAETTEKKTTKSKRQLRQLRRKQRNVRDFCANSCPKTQIYCQTRICAKIIFVLTKKQTQSFSRHWPTSLEKIARKNYTYFILTTLFLYYEMKMKTFFQNAV